MGFKMQDGIWVQGNKKRKADQETVVPSSFASFSPTLKDVVLGLADLKLDFSAFCEEVHGEFHWLHCCHDKVLNMVLARFSSPSIAAPSASSPLSPQL